MEALGQLQAVYAKWEKKAAVSMGSSAQNGSASSAEYDRMMREGRQAWNTRFDKAGRPPPSYTQARSRHRNRRTDFQLPPENVQMSNLAYFKSAPTILPATVKYRRPFAARCCSCMPNSRDKLFENEMETHELYNVLDVDTKRSKNPWLTRTFHHVSFVMQRRVDHKYPRVRLEVLTSPRVVEAVHLSAQRDLGIAEQDAAEPKKLKKAIKQQEKRANKVVRKMSAALSNAFIRFTGWFLHKLLGHLYSTILVHKGQLEMLKDATSHKMPIVFLPTHRSHMDYILLTFTLFNFDIHAPHVAAGDNLLIPFFGSLMRALGGYFIRRKIDGTNNQKDIVYRAVLHSYMEVLLQKGEYFEFFLEGGRSRSGKVLPPKGGLLSVVADAYLTGAVPDVYIVPVNFSYEKLLEGSYSSEQMGEPKQKESFWAAWRAIWRVIHSHYGNVRIDFGQPFSLKEYLQVAQGYGLDQYQTSQWEAEVTSPNAKSRLELCDSSGSLFGMEDHRVTIQGMAEHVLYNCQNVQAMMSTHLVAFLMLTKHRQGACLREVVRSLDWLREEMSGHKRDVGFSGKSVDVILHACDLLGEYLIHQQLPPKSDQQNVEDANNNTPDDLFLSPTISLPHVFELSYYANPATSIFALESVIAAAVCSEAGDEMWVRSGEEKEIMVSSNAIKQRAANICHLLQYEFIFKPPCASWDVVLADGIEALCVCDILRRSEEHGDVREAEWAKRLSNSLSWADEDSDEEEEEQVEDTLYQVCLDSEYATNKMAFLVAVLGPLLEAYYIIACSVQTDLKQPQQEEVFVKTLHNKLKTRVQDGLATYAESCAMDTLRNGIHTLQQLKVVDIYEENKTKHIKLGSSASASDRLQDIIDLLEECRVLNML